MIQDLTECEGGCGLHLAAPALSGERTVCSACARREHEVDMPHACPWCETRRRTLAALERHEQARHADQLPRVRFARLRRLLRRPDPVFVRRED